MLAPLGPRPHPRAGGARLAFAPRSSFGATPVCLAREPAADRRPSVVTIPDPGVTGRPARCRRVLCTPSRPVFRVPPALVPPYSTSAGTGRPHCIFSLAPCVPILLLYGSYFQFHPRFSCLTVIGSLMGPGHTHPRFEGRSSRRPPLMCCATGFIRPGYTVEAPRASSRDFGPDARGRLVPSLVRATFGCCVAPASQLTVEFCGLASADLLFSGWLLILRRGCWGAF